MFFPSVVSENRLVVLQTVLLVGSFPISNGLLVRVLCFSWPKNDCVEGSSCERALSPKFGISAVSEASAFL